MNKLLAFCFNAPAKQTVGQEGAEKTKKQPESATKK